MSCHGCHQLQQSGKPGSLSHNRNVQVYYLARDYNVTVYLWHFERRNIVVPYLNIAYVGIGRTGLRCPYAVLGTQATLKPGFVFCKMLAYFISTISFHSFHPSYHDYIISVLLNVLKVFTESTGTISRWLLEKSNIATKTDRPCLHPRPQTPPLPTTLHTIRMWTSLVFLLSPRVSLQPWWSLDHLCFLGSIGMLVTHTVAPWWRLAPRSVRPFPMKGLATFGGSCIAGFRQRHCMLWKYTVYGSFGKPFCMRFYQVLFAKSCDNTRAMQDGSKYQSSF
jgi:hypothetical protein